MRLPVENCFLVTVSPLELSNARGTRTSRTMGHPEPTSTIATRTASSQAAPPAPALEGAGTPGGARKLLTDRTHPLDDPTAAQANEPLEPPSLQIASRVASDFALPTAQSFGVTEDFPTGATRRSPLERSVAVPEERAELAVLDELDQVQHIELRFESDVACASPSHRALEGGGSGASICCGTYWVNSLCAIAFARGSSGWLCVSARPSGVP